MNGAVQDLSLYFASWWIICSMPHLNLLPLLLSANAIASHRQKAGKPQVGKQFKTFTLMSGKTLIFLSQSCVEE